MELRLLIDHRRSISGRELRSCRKFIKEINYIVLNTTVVGSQKSVNVSRFGHRDDEGIR